MVGFLRERAISLEQQVPSLELEIQECTALGMTSNVSEMSKNLKDMVQNVADDRGIADALRAEAVKMIEDLMVRSEQHLDMVRKGELKALDAMQHRYVLDTIRQKAIQIDIPETSRYRALMDSVVAMSTPTTTTGTPSTPTTTPITTPTPIPTPTPTPASPAPIAAPATPAPIAAPATPVPVNPVTPATPVTPAPIAPASTSAPSPTKLATSANGYSANGNDKHVYSKGPEPMGHAPTVPYGKSRIEIPANVIVGGNIGGIVGAGSTVGKNIAAIEKIVAAAPVAVPLPIKAGWGKIDSAKAPSRSLLDIQKEELSMK